MGTTRVRAHTRRVGSKKIPVKSHTRKTKYKNPKKSTEPTLTDKMLELIDVDQFKKIEIDANTTIKAYPYPTPNYDIYIYEKYNPNIIKQTYKNLTFDQVQGFLIKRGYL